MSNICPKKTVVIPDYTAAVSRVHCLGAGGVGNPKPLSEPCSLTKPCLVLSSHTSPLHISSKAAAPLDSRGACTEEQFSSASLKQNITRNPSVVSLGLNLIPVQF